MPGAVDTRVVSMQFDNRNFEKNIEQSGKSLDKFKEKLDFSKCEDSLKKFEDSTRALKFDAMAENIQRLTDKFTGLGKASEFVISLIRKRLEDLGRKAEQLVHQLSFEPVNAGLEKFAQMTKNVRTIMAATGKEEGEVYDVLGRLNRYTDWTSYNFTDMAANIGKFTSVGIPLEKAEKQMEGIANWAARSGAGITEASRAMYNLSQAMGVGALTKIDWKSIENAGMATKEFKEEMIAAGVASGNLVKTVGKDGKAVYKTAAKFGKQVEVNYKNFSETLSKKWADTNVMGMTFQAYQYEDLTGDLEDEYIEAGNTVIEIAKDKMEKVKQVMDDNKLDEKDWKGLSGEGGIITDDAKKAVLDAGVALGNLSVKVDRNGKKIYTTADKYGKAVTFTMEEMDKSLEAGWLDRSVARKAGLMEDLGKASYKAAQECTSLKDVLGAWKDQLSTGWMRAWQQVFGELGDAIEIFSAICNKVGDSFSSFIETLVGDGEKTFGILGNWARAGGRESLWSMFIGEYDGLYEGAFGILDVFKEIGKLISDGFWGMIYSIIPSDSLSDAFLQNWNENSEYRSWWLGTQLKEATDNIRNFIQSIRDFFEAVPEGGSKSRIQMIRDVVSGIYGVILIIWSAIKETGRFIGEVINLLQPGIDAMLDLMSMLGLGLKDFGAKTYKSNGLRVIFDGLLEVAKPFISAVNEVIKVIANLLKALFGGNSMNASRTFSNIFVKIGEVIQGVAKVISHVATPIVNFVGKIIGAFQSLFQGGFKWENIKAFGQKIIDSLKGLINGLFSFIPDFLGKVKKFFGNIIKVFTSGFSGESLRNLWNSFKEFFVNIKDRLPQGLKDALKNAWNGIKGFFTRFANSVKELFSDGFSLKTLQKIGKKIREGLSSIWNKLPQGVRDGITNAWNGIKGFFTRFANGVKELFSDGFSIKTLRKIGKKIRDGLSSIWNKLPQGVRDGISNAWKGIKGFFTRFANSVKELFSDGFSLKTLRKIGNKIKEGLSSIWNKLPEGVRNGISNAWKGIKGFFTRFANSVKELFSDGFSLKTLQKIGNKIKEAVKSIWDKLPQGVREGITNAWTAVKNFFAPFVEDVKFLFTSGFSAEGFDRIKKRFHTIASSIWHAIPQGVRDGIKNAWIAVKNFFAPFVEDVKFLFESGFSKEGLDRMKKRFQIIFSSIWNAIPQGIRDGISRVWTAIKNFFDPFVQDVKNVFTSGFSKESFQQLGNRFKTTFQSLWEKIPPGIRDGFNKTIGKIGQTLSRLWETLKEKVIGIFTGKKSEGTRSSGSNRKYSASKTITKTIGLEPEIVEKETKSIFQRVLEAIKKAFGDIFGKIGSLFSGLFSGFKKKTGDGVKTVANVLSEFGGTLLKVIPIILGVVVGVKVFKAIKSMIDGLKDVVSNLNDLFHGKKKKEKEPEEKDIESFATKMLKMGAALLLTAIAVKIVGEMKLKDAIQGVGLLAALMILYAGLVIIVNKFKKPKPVKEHSTFMQQLADFVKELTKLILVLVAIAVLNISWMGILKMMATLGGVLLLLIGFIWAISKISKNNNIDLKGLDGIKQLAIAIAIIAVALLPMTLVSWEGYAKMMAGLFGILAGLLLFTLLVSKSNGLKGKGMGALIVLALAITQLIITLIPLTLLNIWDIVTMVGAFVVIVAALAVLVNQTGKMKDWKNGAMATLMVVALAVVIDTLARSIVKIKDVPIEKSIVFFVGLIVLMGIMARMIKNTKGIKWSGGISGMLMMIVLAGIIVALGFMLDMVKDIPIEKTIVFFVGLIVLMGVMAHLIKNVKGTRWSSGISGMLMLIAFAGVAIAVGFGLSLIKNIDWTVIVAFMGGLVLVVLAMSLFIKNAKGLRWNSGIGGMLILISLAAVMVAAGFALSLIKDINWTVVISFMAGLAIVVLSLCVFINSSKGIKLKSAVGILLILIAVAGVMAAAGFGLSLIKGMDWTSIIAFFGGISIAILAIAVLVKAAGGVNFKKAIIICAMLLVFALSVAIIAGSLKKIKGVDPKAILTFSVLLVALSVAMIPLAAAISILGKISPSVAVKGIAVLAALLIALAALAPIIIGAIGNSIYEMMSSLSSASGQIAMFQHGMDVVDENAIDAAKVKFQKLYELVFGLKSMDGYRERIEAFSSMLYSLGSAVDLFNFNMRDVTTNPEDTGGMKLLRSIMNLKDEFANFNDNGIAGKFNEIGNALSLFDTATKDITTSNPPSLELINGIIGKSADIERFNNMPLDEFKTKVEGLGAALSLFAEGALMENGIEEGSMPDIKKTFDMLKTLGAAFDDEIAQHGDFTLPTLPADDNIRTFGESLALLATAMVKFGKASKDFDDEYKKGEEVLTFLSNLQKDLNKDNMDAIQVFDKNNVKYSAISRFGNDISHLGICLKNYNDKLKDFKKNEEAIAVLDYFVELRAKLTPELISDVASTNNDFDNNNLDPDVLKKFGENISGLGGSLKKFADDTKFDDDVQKTLDNAIKTLDAVVDMGIRMPKIGGVKGWFEGNTETLGDLGRYLGEMGNGLQQFSGYLTGTNGLEAVNVPLIESGIKIFESLGDISVAFSKAIESGSFDFGGMAYIMQQMANPLTDYVTTWNNMHSDMHIDSAHQNYNIFDFLVEMMSKMQAAAEKYGGFKETTIFEQFRNFAEAIRALVNVTPNFDFRVVGKKISDGMVEGVEGSQTDLSLAVKNAVSQALKDTQDAIQFSADGNIVLLDSVYNFGLLGEYIASGIKIGIERKEPDVVTAIETLMKNSVMKAMETINANSPSRVFMEIGGYMTSGLAIGINKTASNAVDATKQVMLDAITSADGALSGLSSWLTDTIDPNPTIRPVLDLSNITAGAQMLNGMFGNSNYAIGLASGALASVPQSLVNGVSPAIPKDYTESMVTIKDELGSLREDLRTMTVAVNRIKFVMSSGEIVGAIGPDMDRYLGEKGFYASRTNLS